MERSTGGIRRGRSRWQKGTTMSWRKLKVGEDCQRSVHSAMRAQNSAPRSGRPGPRAPCPCPRGTRCKLRRHSPTGSPTCTGSRPALPHRTNRAAPAEQPPPPSLCTCTSGGESPAPTEGRASGPALSGCAFQARLTAASPSCAPSVGTRPSEPAPRTPALAPAWLQRGSIARGRSPGGL
eukprot:1172424-Rhodomonas_salina.1